MKKLISTITLLFSCMIIVNAQITDGFYHIKNAGTGRYLSISDTDPENYKVSQSGSVNLAGIRTFIDYDSVAVSPSCVIYVKSIGNGKYDLQGQGSSLYAMTSEKLPINITSNGNGSYKIWGTYKGFTKYLTDKSPSSKDGNLVTAETGMDSWTFKPVNTSDQYIGIRPDVKTADGTYYGTIFAGFNFRFVSPGMAAYYISNAGGTGFTMEQIGSDVIPANTPVIIRCNSYNPQDNKIEPVIGGYEFNHSNWLGGVYCSLYVSGHHNVKRFDDITMRLLGLSDKGELAFIANPSIDRLYKEQYLMANKAYLKVNSGDADVMTHGGYTEPEPQAIKSVKADDNASTGLYTLTGVRIPDGVKPSAGIYVKNGKKIIIK